MATKKKKSPPALIETGFATAEDAAEIHGITSKKRIARLKKIAAGTAKQLKKPHPKG